MPAVADPAAKFQGYVHPERLVSTIGGRTFETTRSGVVESDEDTLLYHTGHIQTRSNRRWWRPKRPTCVTISVSNEFAGADVKAWNRSRLPLSFFYGDNFNWCAAYALWVFELSGMPTPGSSTEVAQVGRRRPTDDHIQPERARVITPIPLVTIDGSGRFLGDVLPHAVDRKP